MSEKNLPICNIILPGLNVLRIYSLTAFDFHHLNIVINDTYTVMNVVGMTVYVQNTRNLNHLRMFSTFDQ